MDNIENTLLGIGKFLQRDLHEFNENRIININRQPLSVVPGELGALITNVVTLVPRLMQCELPAAFNNV